MWHTKQVRGNLWHVNGMGRAVREWSFSWVFERTLCVVHSAQYIPDNPLRAESPFMNTICLFSAIGASGFLSPAFFFSNAVTTSIIWNMKGFLWLANQGILKQCLWFPLGYSSMKSVWQGGKNGKISFEGHWSSRAKVKNWKNGRIWGRSAYNNTLHWT